MSDRFTVVFKGDIRAFDGNPLHIVSLFGEVAACGEGDAFEAADTIEALRAENAKLREALAHWDALIRHQYTGSREAMSDMTDCAQETAKLLFGNDPWPKIEAPAAMGGE